MNMTGTEDVARSFDFAEDFDFAKRFDFVESFGFAVVVEVGDARVLVVEHDIVRWNDHVEGDSCRMRWDREEILGVAVEKNLNYYKNCCNCCYCNCCIRGHVLCYVHENYH